MRHGDQKVGLRQADDAAADIGDGSRHQKQSDRQRLRPPSDTDRGGVAVQYNLSLRGVRW